MQVLEHYVLETGFRLYGNEDIHELPKFFDMLLVSRFPVIAGNGSYGFVLPCLLMIRLSFT